MPTPDDLARITLFEGLDRRQLVRLAGIASPASFDRGETIFRQGQEADGFYGITNGRVKLYRTGPDGRQQVLHFFGPGDVFGEAAVFTTATFPAFAESMTASRLVFLPKARFIEALVRDPELALNMLATLSRYLRRFADLIEELSLKEVSARLARFLLELADAEGARVPGGIRVELAGTKSELAARLGTVSETLSRTLGRLRDRGVIAVHGRAITILDHGALETLVSPDEQTA